MKAYTLLLLLSLLKTGLSYDWEKGEVNDPAALCPGRYCGRIQLQQGNFSECGACPRGFIVQDPLQSSLCAKCNQNPDLYDILYLTFILLTTLLSHWVAIDLSAKRSRLTKDVLVLHFSAMVESAAAAAGAVLLSDPIGELTLNACGVKRLSDWYPLLFNPTPNYDTKLYCTQEVVYPLYTIVFIFFIFSLFALMLVRPFLSSHFLPGRGRNAVYAALYFLPVYTLLHAVLGGLIYYSFPYIIIIVSLISCAAHFAFKLDQSLKALVLSTLQDTRNLIILLGHWGLHAFGIIAVTQLKDDFHFGLLALVPFPAIFYVLTARFTDPYKVNAVYEDN